MNSDQRSARVRLHKFKRPGGAFWFDLDLLLQDADGTWLRGSVGSPWGAPHDRGKLSVPVVVLLAVSRPWVAWWVGDPADRRLDIDVCLPPEKTESGWRYTDLEGEGGGCFVRRRDDSGAGIHAVRGRGCR